MSRDAPVIREAREADVPHVREIFERCYGREYPHPELMDDTWLKRAIFGDDVLMLVAERPRGKGLAGTASVVLDIGAHSDLIGEFGRLAVLPEDRGAGVGHALMAKRIEYLGTRLHVGLVENRLTHDHAQRISRAHGFAPVGFLPLKYRFRDWESFTISARYSDTALALRKNHPRVVPEALPLAHLSLENCGIPGDVIVDETALPYPYERDFEIEELEEVGFPSLIRIERGRLRQREVFGPMRLQYGYFKLTKKRATYLVARRKSGDAVSSIAGAIGYTHDVADRHVRIFELIVQSEHAIRRLLEELLERCRREWGVRYVDVDVSAHATRMQRTLLELGFLPVAYVPAMVFHEVERLDVVTMARLLVPLELGELRLVPEVAAYADQVLRAFRRQEVLPRIAAAIEQLPILAGLGDEQRARVAASFAVGRFRDGDRLFVEGRPADEMHVVLAGAVDVVLGEPPQTVGSVGAGESLGELGMLTREPHSATAVARGDTTTARLSLDDFEDLVRRRPDIGMILLRELATNLGRKLQRIDARLVSLGDGPADHAESSSR